MAEALVITAKPKLVKSNTNFNETRYKEKWGDDEMTVKRVDILPNGTSEGSILVVMTSDNLKKAEGENAVITDIFAPRTENSRLSSKEWAEIQYSKTIEALDSAGETASINAAFTEGQEKEFLRDVIKPLLDKLVGKTVVISQYHPKDQKTGKLKAEVTVKFKQK